MQYYKLMNRITRTIKNSVTITALIGYLLIVFYAGAHHHTYSILPVQGVLGLHIPYEKADHDYLHCEKHYVVNSSVSTVNSVLFNIIIYNSEVINPLQTEKNYNCNYFVNNRLRAPPLNS